MSWGSDFTAGLRAGNDIRSAYKDRKFRDKKMTADALEMAADRNLRRELTQKGIDADAPLRDAQTNRIRTLTPGELAESTARARHTNAQAGRTETLTPHEAEYLQAQTRGSNASAGRTETLTPLEADAHRIHNKDAAITEAANQLTLDQARKTIEAGPMAEVTHKYGDGESKFRVPIAEARLRGSEAAYQSPYAAKIESLGNTIANNEGEMAGGDQRTGLFNLKSRADQVSNATAQRTRLQYLEINDQLEKGLISPEEADRRASLLLPRKR
ncbi:MAG TPA: hypothetical protein VL069_15960 [Opitutus sp.]|nr:hypothetical protein [Opitutus sp.]